MAARTRWKIEHVFARLKARPGWRRVRYRGLERNTFDFALLLAAGNLMHGPSLRPPTGRTPGGGRRSMRGGVD